MAACAVSIDDIARNAGIDLSKNLAMKYLKALRITTVSTIAVYPKDSSSIQDLVTKLDGKTTFKGKDYDLENEDADATTAQWTVFLNLAQQGFQRQLAPPSSSSVPTPSPASVAPSFTLSLRHRAQDTILPGVYAKLAQDYKNITMDGEKRHFPEKVLLGAGKILARMYPEHTVTKHYTAVTLGEIMAHRVFTSLGSVNSARKKDNVDRKIASDNAHQLVTKEPEDWDVRGSMMIQDGIEAAKWAWISSRSAPKLMKNSSQLPQIKVLWGTFTLEIAMRMQQNESFPNITDELMADLTTVNDALMQSPTEKQCSEQSSWRIGKGKGKGKGKSSK